MKVHANSQPQTSVTRRVVRRSLTALLAVSSLIGCDEPKASQEEPLALGALGTPGQPIPNATPEQLATFMRGEAVALKRWRPDEGLGPLINVTFCGACHEKPVFGGGAGHYRDFYIYGESFGGGGFSPLGPRSGVLNTFVVDAEAMAAEASGEPIEARDPQGGEHPTLSKRETEPEASVSALRNPIPFFGIGLLAQVPEEEILALADPDDADGDGVSGRPNYDQGYVGRFGVKAQTVSVENFIRGPLFNHLGITSNPLPAELQAALPVPSVAEDREEVMGEARLEELGMPLRVGEVSLGAHQLPQAAAPSSPLTDADGAPDPEMSDAELFDLVSWAMLLAAPAPSPLSAEAELGQGVFEAVGCASCHVPSLNSPQGRVPAYTDLLLHDMGEDLADGLVMGLATGSEFRTSPLWGIQTTGPYLHDGRAHTLEEAISAHGGEAEAIARAFEERPTEERAALISFLESLGGEEVLTAGLLPPNTPHPSFGELGGPTIALTGEERARWERGRALYDRDVGFSEGLGPVFNGDSCRGCHFEPIFGGAGPIGVSAVRFGYLPEEPPTGELTLMQPEGTNLIRRFAGPHEWPSHSGGGAYFEVRQALSTFGLQALYDVPEEELLALADPDDTDGDGVRGVARRLPGGAFGRFGWRGQLPSPREFVADATGLELGLTTPPELGLRAAVTSDDDEHPDPEMSAEDFNDLSFFVERIAPPPMGTFAGEGALAEVGDTEGWLATEGAAHFEAVGCATCHRLETWGVLPRPAFTNMLLHDVQAEGFIGVASPNLNPRLFRTPPLWALAGTAPYWHDGRAPTLEAAVLSHHAEAEGSREAYLSLSREERRALLDFLKGL